MQYEVIRYYQDSGIPRLNEAVAESIDAHNVTDVVRQVEVPDETVVTVANAQATRFLLRDSGLTVGELDRFVHEDRGNKTITARVRPETRGLERLIATVAPTHRSIISPKQRRLFEVYELEEFVVKRRPAPLLVGHLQAGVSQDPDYKEPLAALYRDIARQTGRLRMGRLTVRGVRT